MRTKKNPAKKSSNNELSTKFLVFFVNSLIACSLLVIGIALSPIPRTLKQWIKTHSYYTYTSANANFSFNYPKDFPLTVAPADYFSSYDKEFLDVINFSEEFYFNAGGERYGIIYVTSTQLKDINEYEQAQIKEFNDLKPAYKKDRTPPQFERHTIGGKPASKLVYAHVLGTFAVPEDEYVVIHDGKLYTISFRTDDIYSRKNDEVEWELRDRAKAMILKSLQFK